MGSGSPRIPVRGPRALMLPSPLPPPHPPSFPSPQGSARKRPRPSPGGCGLSRSSCWPRTWRPAATRWRCVCSGRWCRTPYRSSSTPCRPRASPSPTRRTLVSGGALGVPGGGRLPPCGCRNLCWSPSGGVTLPLPQQGFQMLCYHRSGLGVQAVSCKTFTLILSNHEGKFVMKMCSILETKVPPVREVLY